MAAVGHIVSIRHAPTKLSAPRGLEAVLALESRQFGCSLATTCEPLPATGLTPADLVVDLAGNAAESSAPALTIEFCGCDSFPAGLSAMVASGRLPELAARINGAIVARARPMVSDRLWLTRASNDLLAGAISLIVQAVGHFSAGKTPVIADAPIAVAVHKQFGWHYPLFLGKGIAERVVRKLRRGRRPFYWQVAYRLIDRPGVAETGQLDGPPFTVLPDDGQRFYADPFVFELDGRVYLFVEEFPYATGRGVISVTELRGDGTFGRPTSVLQELHHLSYPQVFAHGDDIYMIPESAAARELVLYRAIQFPNVWVRDTILIGDRDINDATLLERGGRLWLIGTERFGYGSASDTMVAYSAAQLRGPWIAHALNPIAIDHSAARPGGAFIRQGSDFLLPVQNGSKAYGGGLGLMQLVRLDRDDVQFASPRPVLSGSAWARRGIHTLNRVGRVEVVDSAG
ncbi:hypothetical protein [Mesorhizobium sp. BAC0120]|uniref:glucosamine inositolphosphorylceramide transferase family protein n=1 Tax=Mesorhizobium sp. BAC0120 TaxID=3090670 RepID=UPI00399C429D